MSEPIQAMRLDPGEIQLRLNGTQVSVTVKMTDADAYRLIDQVMAALGTTALPHNTR